MTARLTPKVEAIVDSGRRLMFRHGIRRVTVEEICREAGVSKMTFYRTFKNKSDLVIQILDQLVSVMMDHFDSLLHKDAPFAEKMQELMAAKIKMSEQFSREFLADLTSDNSQAGKYLAQQRLHANDKIKKFYEDARKKGEIRKDLNIDFLLYFTEYLRRFMDDQYLLGLYPQPAGLMKEVCDFYLYGILGHKGETT